MNYITHKRFKAKALCGMVNIPAMSECSEDDGIIYWQGKRICSIRSQNAYEYFARNDDGLGMERGKLTRAIIKKLSTRDDEWRGRWDKVWADEGCRPYKREEHRDHWLWNHDFYNADIWALRHIATLVGARV